jgi:YihY family inner membrane protein
MSTANFVPETYELTGDDARQTLRRTGIGRLFRDAFVRLRASDGTSHARSLGYTVSLVLIQGLIAVVGLATALGESRLTTVIRDTFESAVPGPAGEIVTSAIDQAQQAGSSERYLALVVGLVGALIAGTTGMAQLERSLNRLYGVEADRPTAKKYGLAFILTVTAGVLGTGAFIAIAFGRSLGESFTNDLAADVWAVVRWPLAVLLILGSIALLLKACPRRHQPAWSWLAYGATAAVVLWFVVTAALALFFRVNDSFGETYGPLAGILALLLWAYLSALAVLFGAALAAQLEAIRAGAVAPQDEQKAVATEPGARVLTPSAIAGR